MHYAHLAMSEVDWQARRRAREARDPRFDGKFFVGILSTKIYCRPSCPVPTVPDKNVRYFETAAAAVEAGFRPCLRCRPECAPGTPAWSGTPATVSRALRLIAESDLGSGGIERLAERLGIGSRHLRRLFLTHVGATPSAVAHTRRLQFAKKLIDETSLPMTQVALASGFASVRRFNAAIRATYNRTPTQIRNLARAGAQQGENEYMFRLRFRPPYDWHGMLAYLAAHSAPGVEAFDGATYRRTIAIGGAFGWFEVTFDEKNHSVNARVHFPDPRSLFLIVERIREIFDLNADWMAIAPVLESDAALADLIEHAPGLRVPGCWDAFEISVRAALEQCTPAPTATSVITRFVSTLGVPYAPADGLTHVFPTARKVSQNELKIVPGFPGPCARILQQLARNIADARIKFDATADSGELVHQLSQINGMADSTAHYIAMRAFAEPDAFPSGDVRLLNAAGLQSAVELQQRSDSWRPWRSYAAMYLWKEAVHRETLVCVPSEHDAAEAQQQHWR